MVGLMATVVSLCSLFVSLYQVKMSREQQYASVWPNLLLFWSSSDNNGEFDQRCTLWNQGIGPAIIRDVHVEYRDKPYPDLSTAVNQLFHDLGRDSLQYASASRSSLLPGFSFAPNQEWAWLSFSGEAGRVWQAHLNEFTVQIRYASVYGEEWVTLLDADLPDSEVVPKKVK